MHKIIKIEFVSDENNISIENTQNDEGVELIQVTIGAFISASCGSDGEAITFTPEEFEEFITECTALLSFAKKGNANG